MSLLSSIPENKHVIKKLTTHVTLTLEVLINKPIKKMRNRMPSACGTNFKDSDTDSIEFSKTPICNNFPAGYFVACAAYVIIYVNKVTIRSANILFYKSTESSALHQSFANLFSGGWVGGFEAEILCTVAQTVYHIFINNNFLAIMDRFGIFFCIVVDKRTIKSMKNLT